MNSKPAPEEGTKPPPKLPGAAGLLRGARLLGAAGLALAIGADFGDVVGRHLGLLLIGAVEPVQIGIVAIVAASLVMAGASGRHASVQLVTQRLSRRWRARLGRAGDAASLAAFGALAGGSVWVSVLLWRLHERTEILHLPLKPVRLVWAGALAVSALMALCDLVRAER